MFYLQVNNDDFMISLHIWYNIDMILLPSFLSAFEYSSCESTYVKDLQTGDDDAI